jgi:NADH dehydrogenase
MPHVPDTRPRVVVIGWWFWWPQRRAARLARLPCAFLLIDRPQPSRVSAIAVSGGTAGLSPGDIASPIRYILRHQRNLDVWLAEAVSDRFPPGASVVLRDGQGRYDHLIVAAGSTHAYFGHDDWQTHAAGLKTSRMRST